ncbi:hypothetical protein [Pseudomonas fluorescens]|uniref:hypothetical protein n=1 Tax=Pseudomonas fluorescens TaxID=294 RepID=UPI001BEA04CD|nr:hypothetical protein [Pseudomonas fluorescens]MBT2375800.1 hypothetical protein [Pseudomonas fluorescens]
MTREESVALSTILAGYKSCSLALLNWINATKPTQIKTFTREQIDEVLAVNERTLRAMKVLESMVK